MGTQEIDRTLQNNSLILAVAGEIGGRAITKMAGNDVSNTLQDSPITKDRIASLIISKITEKLKNAV